MSNTRRLGNCQEKSIKLCLEAVFGTFYASPIIVNSVINFLVCVRDGEKYKKVFYDRTIPTGSPFLIEQSQDYRGCLWELKHNMITKVLKDKHDMILESPRVWTQTIIGQLMVIKGIQLWELGWNHFKSQQRTTNIHSTHKWPKYTENTMEVTRRVENNSLCKNGSRGRRGRKNGSSCAYPGWGCCIRSVLEGLASPLSEKAALPFTFHYSNSTIVPKVLFFTM